MDCVIYARVSSDEQVNNTSLDTQVSAMRKYAETHGLTIVDTFLEDYTGTKLSRPQLDRLREIVKSQRVSAILAYSPDRLTRTPAHGIQLREEIALMGRELHFVSRGKVDFSPAGELISTIEDHMNKHWLISLKEASERGWHGKIEKDQYVGRGVVPYGYKRVGKRNAFELEPNEVTSLVVIAVFQMFTREDMSVQEIAETLNAQGIPTPGGNPQWVYKMIYSILNNQIYIGKNRAFAFKMVDGKRIRQPAEKHAIVSSPVIIELETWMAANKKLAARSGISTTRKYQYLMARRIRCVCGSAACGVPTTTQKYYRCLSFNSLYKKPCGLLGFRVDRLDGAAWDFACEIIEDQAAFFAGFQEMEEGRENRVSRLIQRQSEIEVQIDRHRQRLSECLDLIMKLGGRHTTEIIEQRMVMIEADITDLHKELEGIRTELGGQREIPSTELREFIVAFIEARADNRDNFEFRRGTIATLDIRALLEMKDGDRIVHFNWKSLKKTVNLTELYRE